MYGVLNTLSDYTYFYISKKITSYNFVLVFKIVESLECILNIMTRSKRHTTEYFADIFDDLKRSFSTGKIHAAT